MSVLTCPSCRGSLTAASAAAPYVVGCPHCRQPLTVPAAGEEPFPEPSVEESPFETTPDTRSRSRYRRAKSRSSGRWWALGAAAVLLVVGVGAVFLLVPGALRDAERHQMDSYYSELEDDIQESFKRFDAANSPLAADGFIEQKAMLNVADRYTAAQSKLLADYKAKYGAGPKYLKPKDRAKPNPMRLRYPTDK